MGPDRLSESSRIEDAEPRRDGGQWVAVRSVLCGRSGLFTHPSFAGKDYAQGEVTPADPQPVNWYDLPQYQPYLDQWKQRWEFRGYLNRAKNLK